MAKSLHRSEARLWIFGKRQPLQVRHIVLALSRRDESEACPLGCRLADQSINRLLQLVAGSQRSPLVREEELQVGEHALAYLGWHIGFQQLEQRFAGVLIVGSGEDVHDAGALAWRELRI